MADEPLRGAQGGAGGVRPQLRPGPGLAHPPQDSRWYDLVGRVLRGERIESARGGKEVHALDVARAVDVLLRADARRVAGQSFR